MISKFFSRFSHCSIISIQYLSDSLIYDLYDYSTIFIDNQIGINSFVPNDIDNKNMFDDNIF